MGSGERNVELKDPSPWNLCGERNGCNGSRFWSGGDQTE